MWPEESDLSLSIAQIVQKLKGSNLYAQLERQAWVSEAAGRDGDGAAATPPGRWEPLGPRLEQPLGSPAPRLCAESPLFRVPTLSLARGVVVF